MKFDHKQNIQLALKKALGTLKKVSHMVEKDEYCIDVMQQINAVMGLLRNTNARIVKNHLETCGYQKMSSQRKKTRDEFANELLKALDLSLRK